MVNCKPGGEAYNRFVNLDGVEDRIIYWLLSPNNKNKCELAETYKIWKLLVYDDIDALNKPLPKYKDVVKLICNDNVSQDNFRIFRSCHLEEAWTIQSNFLKIYIDSILPENHVVAQVNIGVDIIVHNKIINVNVPEDEKIYPIDIIDGIEYNVNQKSRVSILTKAVLSLLNGADVQGVGRLTFSMEMNRWQQAQYEIWNNRNFEGMKVVLGTRMGGVG